VTLLLETCRVAFELRKPDARRQATQALVRARQHGDAEQARALAELLEIHRHRRLGPEDVGPTPETLVRRRLGARGDAIEALVRSRSLNWAQQAAALQIAEVCEALTSGLETRCASWQQGRVDGAGGIAEIATRLAAYYARCYLPWARWMRAPDSLFQGCRACGRAYLLPQPLDACEQCGGAIWQERPQLALVLSIVAFGAGLHQCAAAYRMRYQRALRLLKLGLDRYGDFVKED
jgi:hypothetical protein